MAKSNKADKRRVDPVVSRLWARKFPATDLEFINVLRPDAPDGIPYTCFKTILVFNGKAEDLLRYGIIEPVMMPVKPKRKASWTDGRYICNLDVRSHEMWHSEWRARGVLHVWREISQKTPRAHPLAALGPWNWPFDETTTARRERLQLRVNVAMQLLKAVFDSTVYGIKESIPLEEDPWERVRPLVSRFEAEFAATLAGTRVKPGAHRMELQLVVDNTR
jgi:hypothetical protein